MARHTKRIANKDYGTYTVGSAFTREKGIEVATSDEATTNNRYVVYTVYCKTCKVTVKKVKAALHTGFQCDCGTLHTGYTKDAYRSKSAVCIFLAGESLVMVALPRDEAEAAFRNELEYLTYYNAWKEAGSVCWETEASALSIRQRTMLVFGRGEDETQVKPPELKNFRGLPTYTYENADAETKAAYEAELNTPIRLPAPSDRPLGEVFTTAVTRAALEKHANYFDNLNTLANAIGLRPPAPNQRSGWLASARTRNMILVKERHGGNANLPPIYQDASARFESVATYPVNDIEEVWYYLYEYAPSSPDDIPDF